MDAGIPTYAAYLQPANPHEFGFNIQLVCEQDPVVVAEQLAIHNTSSNLAYKAAEGHVHIRVRLDYNEWLRKDRPLALQLMRALVTALRLEGEMHFWYQLEFNHSEMGYWSLRQYTELTSD